jgi:hypothetical protein
LAYNGQTKPETLVIRHDGTSVGRSASEPRVAISDELVQHRVRRVEIENRFWSKAVSGKSTRMLRACPVARTRSRPPKLGTHLDPPRITIASIYRVRNARDSRLRPANTRHRIGGSGSDVSSPVSDARFGPPVTAKFSVRPTPSGTRSRNLSERIVWVSFATNNIGSGAAVL